MALRVDAENLAMNMGTQNLGLAARENVLEMPRQAVIDELEHYAAEAVSKKTEEALGALGNSNAFQ